MGPHRDQPRVLSDRRARQLRDALLLAASLGVLGGVLLLRRGEVRNASPSPAGATASAAPSPQAEGGEPEPVALDAREADAACDLADHGFGAYARWRPLALGKLLVPPARAAIGADGGYDLLVHFHGAEPVRKVLAPTGLALVVAGVDVGTRPSEYARAVDGGWDALLQAIDREVERAAGIAGAHARRLLLSSWGAGSGAIGRIIERGSQPVDAVILLDSLHGTYMPGQTSLIPGQLAPYVTLARAAARGAPLLYLTHTETETPARGYASTQETATFLLNEIGASPVAVTARGESAPSSTRGSGAEAQASALRLTRMYDGGSLYVRGYAGTGPDGHCAQLRLLPAILTDHVLPVLGR